MYLPKAEIVQMELVEPCCNLGIMYYLEHDQFQGQNEPVSTSAPCKIDCVFQSWKGKCKHTYIHHLNDVFTLTRGKCIKFSITLTQARINVFDNVSVYIAYFQ